MSNVKGIVLGERKGRGNNHNISIASLELHDENRSWPWCMLVMTSIVKHLLMVYK